MNNMGNRRYDNDVQLNNFIGRFFTADIIRKYHIKSVEKTNVCYKGKGLLVPFIEFFVKGFVEEKDIKMLKENFISAYKKYFNTDIEPGINIQNSALWVREYNGRYFHLCTADDSKDKNFIDYEVFEVTSDGYNFILNQRYAYFGSRYDEKLIRRFNSKDKEYEEIYTHCLSENLLQMI